MFQELENNYKKQLKEKKFNKFYWISASILIVITRIFQDFFIDKYYLIYIILGIIVIIYFIFDYNKTLKNVKKSNSIFKNLMIYVNQARTNRINSLIINMKRYNIKTKTDIKMTIDYYNNKQPIKVESSYFGWIISSILTISSFIQIAYDNEKQVLDYTKISAILGSSLGIIICLLIPILIIKSIISSIVFSKEKLHSNISEDLTYIYFNFNKYKNQLNK